MIEERKESPDNSAKNLDFSDDLNSFKRDSMGLKNDQDDD